MFYFFYDIIWYQLIYNLTKNIIIYLKIICYEMIQNNIKCILQYIYIRAAAPCRRPQGCGSLAGAAGDCLCEIRNNQQMASRWASGCECLPCHNMQTRLVLGSEQEISPAACLANPVSAGACFRYHSSCWARSNPLGRCHDRPQHSFGRQSIYGIRCSHSRRRSWQTANPSAL